jgi:hypothetical protein
MTSGGLLLAVILAFTGGFLIGIACGRWYPDE